MQVFALLSVGVPSHCVARLVEEHELDVAPTDDYLQEVLVAGGEDELISSLKNVKVTLSLTFYQSAP